MESNRGREEISIIGTKEKVGVSQCRPIGLIISLIMNAIIFNSCYE